MGFRSDIKGTQNVSQQPVTQQPQQQERLSLFSGYRNPFKSAQQQALQVGGLLGRGVKSLPRLRSNQEVANAALGVGKGLARSTVLPLAKLGVVASPLYNPFTKEKLNTFSSNIEQSLAPKTAQESGGQAIGKIGGNLLTYGLAGKVAAPLNVSSRVAGVLGGTAAGQADVPEGKSRGKKALTDAALLTAFAGVGAGIDKYKAVKAAKNFGYKFESPDQAQSAIKQITDQVSFERGIKSPDKLYNSVIGKVKISPTDSIDDVTAKVSSALKAQGYSGDDVASAVNNWNQSYKRLIVNNSPIANQRMNKEDFQLLSQGDIGTKSVKDIRLSNPTDKTVVEDYIKRIRGGENIPPIVVTKNGTVIDGNNRLEAFKRLGFKNVNTVEAPIKSALGVLPKNASAKAKALAEFDTKAAQILNEKDVEGRVIKALREAKPLRSKQEAIYSQVRGERLAKGLAAEKAAGGGEAGYLAKKAQLAGELPKVDFESLKGKVKQSDIDTLFNKVQNSDLNEWEKLPATEGLSKLLGASGGQVPTNNEIQLLNRVFPDEFIAETLAKRSAMQKLFEGTANVLNIPRTALATADLSAPLRQGIFLGPKHPLIFGKNFGKMFKQFGSEKYYKESLNNIRSRPTYGEMVRNNLEITDASSPTLSAREESFMTDLLDRIPGIGAVTKASNRAYSGFLNNMRADVFDQIYKNAEKAGVLESNPALLASAAKFVNSASGRGDLGQLNQAVPILNAGLFSPRLIASRVNLLNPVFYAKLDPFVRKEALKNAAAFAGFVATVLGLAKLGGAEVEDDIRSTDFGQIKVGKTRYDFTGGFRPYIVLAGRLATGESVNPATGELRELGNGFTQSSRADILGRFARSKESPVASFVHDALKGETFTGEDFNTKDAIASRVIPLMAQDIYEIQQGEGTGQAVAGGLASTFGVGVNTFRDQIPYRDTTASGKPTVKFKAPPSLGEALVNKLTGEQPSNIPQDQWAPLLAKKKGEQEQKTNTSFIKARVKKTGKSEVYQGKVYYLQDGEVKSRSL